MTDQQRRLMREWFIGGCLLLALIVFDVFTERSSWWLRLVFMTVAMIALAGRSRLELAGEGRSNLADLAGEAPWLKVWAAFWGAAIALGAVYVTRHSIDLSSLGLFRVIMIPVGIMIGPFVYLIERQKFIELGEVDRAT